MRTAFFNTGLWLALSLTAAAETLLIDAFPYPDAASAGRVWQAKATTPAVRQAAQGALQFPVPFAEDRDRVYWDRELQLDLSGFDALHLELTAPQPDALRSLALYLRSGDGWYIWNRPLPGPGRQTLHLRKADFETEGRPAGWHRIEAIRLSPWKGHARNTTLTLHRLTARNASIVVVRGGRMPAAELAVARRATDRISQWLGTYNLSHAVIDDAALNAERLRHARIVVFPYSQTLTDPQREDVRRFVARGGRVMVFFSSDEGLANLLGFRLGPYGDADEPGRWSAIRFDQPQRWRVPERVYQQSWSIRPALPRDASARVIAYWENSLGQKTEDPAWVLSDRGAWMSHIPLPGDEQAKRRMLATLLAQLDPALWPEIAHHARAQAGRIGPYANLGEASSRIRAAAGPRERRAVNQALAQAEQAHRRMETSIAAGAFPDSVAHQQTLREHLLDAYARVQQPRAGERRGVWDHHGTGLYPGAWDRTARVLAEHGLNTVFPNMLWGGLAHYPSDVLPRSMTYRRYGDQMAACVQAARAHGLEVHVWVVCGSLGSAPADFVQQMQREGRLIRTADGTELPWLNPAHPANRELLIASLLEVARYDIDGIHLDYIRYPHRQACYSDYSRQRFEQALGRPVARWPADALPGGPLDEAFRAFRAEQITQTVRAIRQRVGRAHPDLKISAAVWGGYPDVIASIGQDWVPWLRAGYVDFVVPMNYTDDLSRFAHLTRTQLAWPGAQGRIWPGIGVTSGESQLDPDQVIDQINQLRKLGAHGWVLFDLNHTLRSHTLPALRKGVTREP